MLHYVALPVVWGTATIAASALVLGKTRWIHDTNASFPSILLLLLLWPLAMPAILFELLRTIALQWLGVNPASVPNLDAQDAILGLSGTALAQMIRDGKLTSAELTARCIARVKKVNPLVNAVVCPRFKMAMEEAWWADEMLQANLVPAEHASLWGVPCLVKECFELPGLPFTAGIASRAGIVGKVTAPAIQRVLDAGMPVIGTTNVSEACMFHESNNTLYGLTRNPFDLARTAGGSSGGCGAGVASRMAPVAVTSDVGGSTRIPAFYNGLFGHKPTGATVPNTGTMPKISPGSAVSKYCQIGPTARSAYDLMPLLRVLAGSDGVDLVTRENTDHLNFQNPEDVAPGSLTVYNFTEAFAPQFLRCGLHPELRAAQAKAVQTLVDVDGCKVVNVTHDDLPEISEAFAIWSAMLDTAQEIPFVDLIYSESEASTPGVAGLLLQLGLSIVGLGQSSTHTTPAIALALLEKLSSSFHAENKRLCEKGAALKVKLDALLADNSSSGCTNCILVVPSILTPAPRHHENMLRFFSSAQTSLFNVMELPATAVPLGVGTNGLPLGIQIVAAENNDYLAIAAAMHLERHGLAYSPSP